jgi:hypothetical protein
MSNEDFSETSNTKDLKFVIFKPNASPWAMVQRPRSRYALFLKFHKTTEKEKISMATSTEVFL